VSNNVRNSPVETNHRRKKLNGIVRSFGKRREYTAALRCL
jgi:hypothetical protein